MLESSQYTLLNVKRAAAICQKLNNQLKTTIIHTRNVERYDFQHLSETGNRMCGKIDRRLTSCLRLSCFSRGSDVKRRHRRIVDIKLWWFLDEQRTKKNV